MKHKLNGLDRLIIPKLFAEEGNMLEQITIKEINEKVAIKSEEFKEYGLKEKADGNLEWDSELIKVEKDYDLTKAQTQCMKDAVDKKDKDNKITQWILETCQKIKKMR